MTKEQMLQAVNRICRYYENLREDILLDDIGTMARELLDAQVHILSADGQLLGCTACAGDGCRLNDRQSALRIAQSLTALTDTRITVDKNGVCPFREGSCSFKERTHIVIPLYFASGRIGTLVCTRDGDNRDELYQALCKILAMLCSMAVYNDSRQKQQADQREYSSAQQALASLSFTERKAVDAVFRFLQEQTGSGNSGLPHGLLNASEIAKREGITRSVIASAIKKLESAGMLSVKSLGMKGTYISLLNASICDMPQADI